MPPGTYGVASTIAVQNRLLVLTAGHHFEPGELGNIVTGTRLKAPGLAALELGLKLQQLFVEDDVAVLSIDSCWSAAQQQGRELQQQHEVQQDVTLQQHAQQEEQQQDEMEQQQQEEQQGDRQHGQPQQLGALVVSNRELVDMYMRQIPLYLVTAQSYLREMKDFRAFDVQGPVSVRQFSRQKTMFVYTAETWKGCSGSPIVTVPGALVGMHIEVWDAAPDHIKNQFDLDKLREAGFAKLCVAVFVPAFLDKFHA